jgi:hypothetical protein
MNLPRVPAHSRSLRTYIGRRFVALLWSRPLACKRKALAYRLRRATMRERRVARRRRYVRKEYRVGLLKLVLPDELNTTPGLGCGGRSARYPAFATLG